MTLRVFAIIATVLLLASVAANVLLYRRSERLRPHIGINGKTVTRKEYHDWLEQHYGKELTAAMVKRRLILDAATKENVMPVKADIDQQLADLTEIKPQMAMQFKMRPWTKTDAVEEIEASLALGNLTTKNVKFMEDELKGFFNVARNKWDRPTKIYCKALRCVDPETAQKVADGMRNSTRPGSKPGRFSITSVIELGRQYSPKAQPMWVDGTWVLWKPFDRLSGDPFIDEVSKMKPGEVKVISVGTTEVASLVVGVEYIDNGQAAQLEDPLVRKRVERDFKLTRATPPQEVLRALWDAAKIDTDETTKNDIALVLFPERAQQAMAQAKADK